MYEVPGGVMGLEPVTASVATATGARDITRSQNFCGRKAALLQPSPHQPVIMPTAPASAPPVSSFRPFWPEQEAPISPWRKGLAAGPVQRRGGGAAAAVAVVAPAAASQPAPLALTLLVKGGSADGSPADDDGLDVVHQPLPSMVPDDEVPPRLLTGRSLRGLSGPHGSTELHPLGSPGGRGRELPTDAAAGTGPPLSAGRPQVPSSPLSSHGRSLRAAAVPMSSANGTHAFPQPPQSLPPPSPSYRADGGGAAAAATIVSGPESPLPKTSYKSQMRRLRVAVSGLGGVAEDFPYDDDGDDEDEDGYSRAEKRSSTGMLGGRSRMLREQSSGLEDGAPKQRSASTHAWGPNMWSGAVQGNVNSSGVHGSSAPASASVAARPSPDSPVGFSRRPEDLPAAPLPSHSRSLAGGSVCSTPGTVGSLGGGGSNPRLPLAWQASNSSAASSSSIGFSRRLEDLPAAPSPSNSRSLAGGGGGSARSGPSTPASPAASFAVHRAAHQLLGAQPVQQPRSSAFGGAAGAAPDAPRSPTRVYHSMAPQQQQQQLQPQRGPSGDPSIAVTQQGASPASGAPSNTPSTRAVRVAASTAAPPSAGPPAPAPAPRPQLQRQGSQSVGFSRRPEDLLAAPMPSHSRSLTGGAGSSASSTRSWCEPLLPALSLPQSGAPGPNAGGRGPGAADSPHTPPSPATSNGTRTSCSSRRVDEMPAAPQPSQSRSLRPDSGRLGLRSPVNGGAGGARALGGTPSSPLAWQSSAGAGGGGDGIVAGLRTSLGSPAPPTASYTAAGTGGVPQRGPTRGRDDSVELPLMNGEIVEDLSD